MKTYTQVNPYHPEYVYDTGVTIVGEMIHKEEECYVMSNNVIIPKYDFEREFKEEN